MIGIIKKYTNSNWLVYNNPGKSNHGLFVRNKENQTLIYCKKNNKILSSTRNDSQPSFFGNYIYEGINVIPVFELISKELLSDEFKPQKISALTDIDEEVIKRIASEIAETAFENEIDFENSNYKATAIIRFQLLILELLENGLLSLKKDWKLEILSRDILGFETKYTIQDAVSDLKNGLIEIKNDKDGNLGGTIGRKSFSSEKIIENLLIFDFYYNLFKRFLRLSEYYFNFRREWSWQIHYHRKNW